MLELPYSIAILVALLAALCGVRYGSILHARGFRLTGQVRVRDCPLIPVCLLLFVALHVATGTITADPTIGWALPVALEYYLTGIMWVLKSAFAAFGLSAVVAVGFFQRSRLWRPLALFAIAALLFMDGLTRLAVQPFVGEVRHTVRDGVILQTTPSTCAAASAANIAGRFGMAATEADMVRHLNTTWAGTSPAQLVFGFRSLGLQAQKVYIPERDLRQVKAPAILLVEMGGEPDAHAVAYMGSLGDRFEIWDPNGGRKFVSGADAAVFWQGRAIEVYR